MDTGQTAWYLVAGIIVLFMTPGIAFFYGGLVKSKSVISMLMMSFGAMGIIGVLWVLYGFNMGTMAAGDGNLISGIAGNPFSDFGLGKMANSNESGFLAVFYGATFAMATVALISGAIADRSRFVPWMIFAALWGTFNYFLVQGWVWSPGGWVFDLGTSLGLDASTIDYAGGTAVHINSAAAALALAIVLGKRVGFAKGADQAHNVPLTLIGVAILFAGWFGFNGGAAAFSDNLEGLGLIVINTFAAATAGILGWVTVEHFKEGKSTSVGAGSGAIAGLVAITPACANLYPLWAIALGLLAGGLCAYAIEMKYKFGFDDSLDVVGIHGVGGFVGCWFLGFFATDTGLVYSGKLDQLIVQVIASVGVALFSLTITFIIGYAIEKTIGFRVANEAELAGVDKEIHGEDAYAFGM